MKLGNWIPISKAFAGSLPKDRAFTELEAAFCLQVDYDQGRRVTVSGYAALWRWSRKKVRSFFNKLGIEVAYPEDTRRRQNQKGQIGIQKRDRKGTDKGQIRLIDSKDLGCAGDRKGTDKEQKGDRSGTTTKDPNPENNPKSKNSMVKSAEKIFDHYVSEIDPQQRSRQRALKNIAFWLGKNSYEDLQASIDRYKPTAARRDRSYRKDPANFFGRREPAFQDFLREEPEAAPVYAVGDGIEELLR